MFLNRRLTFKKARRHALIKLRIMIDDNNIRIYQTTMRVVIKTV